MHQPEASNDWFGERMELALAGYNFSNFNVQGPGYKGTLLSLHPFENKSHRPYMGMFKKIENAHEDGDDPREKWASHQYYTRVWGSIATVTLWYLAAYAAISNMLQKQKASSRQLALFDITVLAKRPYLISHNDPDIKFSLSDPCLASSLRCSFMNQNMTELAFYVRQHTGDPSDLSVFLGARCEHGEVVCMEIFAKGDLAKQLIDLLEISKQPILGDYTRDHIRTYSYGIPGFEFDDIITRMF